MKTRHIPSATIQFVAKAGFITKELWDDYFFKGGTDRWRHKGWQNLVKRKYLISIPFCRLRNTYTLNRANCHVNRIASNSVRPPPLAQIDHDECLMRGLLELERAKVISSWTTEAELKSQCPGGFKIASGGQLIKYPDAIVEPLGDRSNQLWALELELTMKNRARYVQILSAYAGMENLTGVIFIYRTLAIKHALLETVEKIYFPTNRIKIFFVNESEWRAKTMAATVHSLFSQ